MDPEDSFAQVGKSNEIISVKEEVVDDNCFPDSLGLKEEVASICDDDQGYMLNSSFGYEEIKAEPGVFVMFKSDVTSQEDKNISLGLVNDGGDGECFSQCRTQPPCSNVKSQKMRKKCKSKRKKKLKFSKKAKDVENTGRISRDEILKNQEYFCSLCQQSYLGRKCFKQHFKVHFTICQSRYACHICNYSSTTISHINRHLLDRHFLQEQKSNVEKLFSCKFCEKSFYDNKSLQRHTYVHTHEGQIKCGECDFSCIRKPRLETHMSSFHGYPRVSHQRPAKSKNDNTSILKCSHCNYSTESRGALRLHIKRHLGNSNYECPECGYTCCERGDFQKHLTVHSDDRPYVCDKCKRSFKRKSHLVSHFKGKNSCGLVMRKKKSFRAKKLNDDWY